MCVCMQRMYSSSMYVYFPSLKLAEGDAPNCSCDVKPQSPDGDEYTDDTDGAYPAAASAAWLLPSAAAAASMYLELMTLLLRAASDNVWAVDTAAATVSGILPPLLITAASMGVGPQDTTCPDRSTLAMLEETRL